MFQNSKFDQNISDWNGVEKCSDDLWIGVKGQSNFVIAGSLFSPKFFAELTSELSGKHTRERRDK